MAYHYTPLSTSARIAATGTTFNSIFDQLDRQLEHNRNRISSVINVASGIVSSTVNGAVSAGGSTIVLHDITGFEDDAYVVYELTTGAPEMRKIDTLTVATRTITLTANTSDDIDDGALISMITLDHYLSAGNYNSLSDRLEAIDKLPGNATQLSAAVSSTDTSIPLRSGSEIPQASYIIIEPFSSAAELRKITGRSGDNVTVAALSANHPVDSTVLWTDRAEWSALLWGATGDGTTNDTTAINAAIAAANAIGGGVVFLPGGTYLTTAAIDLKQYVTLRMTRNTTIATASDVNVIEMEKESSIDGGGGKIYVSNASYTKAAIYLAGSEQIAFHTGASMRIANLNLDAVNQAGLGIYIYCHGDNTFDYVTGVTFEQVQVTKFEYGLRILCVEGGNTCFANDNRFSNCWFSYNTYPISIEGGNGEPFAANSNLFVNTAVQTSVATTLPVYVESARNVFSNFNIWDFPGGTPAIQFGPISYGNQVAGSQIDAWAVLDQGERNEVRSSYFRAETLGQMSDTAATGRLHAHYGLHDSQLAYANDEMTISQTAGSAATSGSWANVFSDSLDGLIQWGPSGPPTLPITVEFTFGFNIYGVTGVGINFVTPHVPGGLKIELYDGAGAAYDTIYDTTGHGDEIRNLYVPLIQIDDGYLYRAKYYTKMRLTIKSLGASATAIAISNILLHSSHHPGRRWLSRKAPQFIGDVTIANTLIIDSGATDFLVTRQSADTNARFLVNSNGYFFFGNGTTTPVVMLYRASDTELRVPDGVTTHAGNGAYNGGHIQMGNYHLWVDATGDLRIKSGAPSSDTDGTVVGTQS